MFFTLFIVNLCLCSSIAIATTTASIELRSAIVVEGQSPFAGRYSSTISSNIINDRRMVERWQRDPWRSRRKELVVYLESEDGYSTTDPMQLVLGFPNGIEQAVDIDCSEMLGIFFVDIPLDLINSVGYPTYMKLVKERVSDEDWKPKRITAIVRDGGMAHSDWYLFFHLEDPGFVLTATHNEWEHSLDIPDSDTHFAYVLKTETTQAAKGDVYSTLVLKNGVRIRNKLYNKNFEQFEVGVSTVATAYPFKLEDVDYIEITDESGALVLSSVRVYTFNHALLLDSMVHENLSVSRGRNIVDFVPNYNEVVLVPYVKAKLAEVVMSAPRKVNDAERVHLQLHLDDGRVLKSEVSGKNYTFFIPSEPYYVNNITKIVIDNQTASPDRIVYLSALQGSHFRFPIYTESNEPETLPLGVTVNGNRTTYDLTQYGQLTTPHNNTYKEHVVNRETGETILGFSSRLSSLDPAYIAEDFYIQYSTEPFNPIEYSYLVSFTEEQIQKHNEFIERSRQLDNPKAPRFRFELDLLNAEPLTGFIPNVAQFSRSEDGTNVRPVYPTISAYREDTTGKVVIEGNVFPDTSHLLLLVYKDSDARSLLPGTSLDLFNLDRGEITLTRNTDDRALSSEAYNRVKNELSRMMPRDVVDYILDESLDLSAGKIGDAVVSQLPSYISIPFGSIIRDTLNDLIGLEDIVVKDLFTEPIAPQDSKDDFEFRYKVPLTSEIKGLGTAAPQFRLTANIENAVGNAIVEMHGNTTPYNTTVRSLGGDRYEILSDTKMMQYEDSVTLVLSTNIGRDFSIDNLAKDIYDFISTLGIRADEEKIRELLQEHLAGGDVVAAISGLVIDNIPVVGTLISLSGLQDNLERGIRRILALKEIENRVSFSNIRFEAVADANPSIMYINNLAFSMSQPYIDADMVAYYQDYLQQKLGTPYRSIDAQDVTKEMLILEDAKYSWDGQRAKLKLLFNQPVFIKNYDARVAFDMSLSEMGSDPYLDVVDGRPAVIFTLDSRENLLRQPDLFKTRGVLCMNEVFFRVLYSGVDFMAVNHHAELTGYKEDGQYYELFSQVSADKYNLMGIFPTQVGTTYEYTLEEPHYLDGSLSFKETLVDYTVYDTHAVYEFLIETRQRESSKVYEVSDDAIYTIRGENRIPIVLAADTWEFNYRDDQRRLITGSGKIISHDEQGLVVRLDYFGTQVTHYEYGVGRVWHRDSGQFYSNTEELSSVTIPLPDKPIEEVSDPQEDEYCLSGKILDVHGQGIEGVRITFSDGDCVTTDEEGRWQAEGFTGSIRVVPIHDVYSFSPAYYWVQGEEELHFTGGTWIGDVWKHINLNVRDFEPFQDKRVRQALMLGIDRQRLIEEIEGLVEYYTETSYLPYSPRHPLVTVDVMEEIHKYQYDPLQAKTLLNEAGFGPDGEELYINFRTEAGNTPRERVQLLIKEMWEELGIVVEIENLPSSQLLDPSHLYRREWPGAIMFAWIFYPTALPNLWHSYSIPTKEYDWSGQNVAGWSNPEADRLIEKIVFYEEENEENKRAYMGELMEIWSNDLPSLPLFFRINFEEDLEE